MLLMIFVSTWHYTPHITVPLCNHLLCSIGHCKPGPRACVGTGQCSPGGLGGRGAASFGGGAERGGEGGAVFVDSASPLEPGFDQSFPNPLTFGAHPHSHSRYTARGERNLSVWKRAQEIIDELHLDNSNKLHLLKEK